MLTIEDIETALGNKIPMCGQVSMGALATLKEFTDVHLMIDTTTFDYFYALDVNKLMESQATKDCLKDLVDDGWSLSDDKKSIIKYIQNFT